MNNSGIKKIFMTNKITIVTLAALLGVGVACQVHGMNEQESTKKDVDGRWSDPFSDGEDSGDEVFLQEKLIEQERVQERKKLQEQLKDLKENALVDFDMWMRIQDLQKRIQDLQKRFPDK